MPTVQDLYDLLSTLESDDDDERARILRRAQRAASRASRAIALADALDGQELGPVLSSEAISHVRAWLKERALGPTPAPGLQLVPKPLPKKLPPPPLPPRGKDRKWGKRW